MKIGIIGYGKLGKEIAKLLTEFKIYNRNENFEQFVQEVDILIDCTTSGFNARAQYINKPIVIATTQKIEQLPINIPIMLIPNGSFSWNLLHNTIIKLAKSGNYQFLIQDIHHANKKDAPSGTAKKLINELTQQGSKVEVASIRAFDIVGMHSIYAFNEDEFIKIEHQINDRAIFAKGIIKAAKWLISQPNGQYNISDLFEKI